MSFLIKILDQKADIAPLYALFSQLNPHLSEQRYLDCLDDMLPRGYRMLTVWDGEECVGMSGIWTATKFYSGKYYELDNVVVDSRYRSKGIGKIMCDHIEKMAAEEGVETLMLDAYRDNFKAHIFYEREGFFPRGFHFVKPLVDWSKKAITPLPERFKILDKETRES